MRALALALVAAAAVLIQTTSAALADVEPNEIISHAEGPITSGTLTGTLSSTADSDYYVFYINGPQALNVTVRDATNDPGQTCMSALLSDTDGKPLPASVGTLAGTTRHFIRLLGQSQTGCKFPTTYEVRIEPAGAITTGPSLDRTTSPTDEPNETPELASGPLSIGVAYVGTHERTEDQDWFHYTTPAGLQLLEATVTSPDRNFAGCGGTLALYSSPNPRDFVAGAIGDWTSFGRIRQTLLGSTRYFFRAGVENPGCLNSRWQFRVDSIMPAPPGTPPPPGPPPSQPPGVPTPSPAQLKYVTTVTLRRLGTSYRGRLASDRAGCKVDRRMVLRRVGRGTRSYGTVRSRGDGTFRINRARRLSGRVYVVAAERSTSAVLCRAGRSPAIRG